MSAPSIQQNVIVTEPTLADLLDLYQKDTLLKLNCHQVGTIQAFNPETQTVSVSLNYQRTYTVQQSNGAYQNTLRNFSLLTDVPIIIMSGGTAGLTFPIAVGDTCMLLFNDRSLNNWLASGQVGPVDIPRYHSISDAVALIGVRPSTNPVANYDPVRAVLYNNDTMVGVGAKVKIANNAAGTLNTILQDILTQLQELTVICASPGSASGPPVNAAAIATLATQLGELLE